MHPMHALSKGNAQGLRGPGSLAVARELLICASGRLSAWDHADAAPPGHGAPDRAHLQTCEGLIASAAAILLARTAVSWHWLYFW